MICHALAHVLVWPTEPAMDWRCRIDVILVPDNASSFKLQVQVGLTRVYGYRHDALVRLCFWRRRLSKIMRRKGRDRHRKVGDRIDHVAYCIAIGSGCP